MIRVLVAVDGSESALRAVAVLIDLVRKDRPVEVHLLNVQPPIRSGELRRFVTREMIDAYYHEEGESALRSAKQLFDEAGGGVHRGHKGRSYRRNHSRLRQATALRQPGHGDASMGAIANLVLGSTATKVLHLVDIPVTLVK